MPETSSMSNITPLRIACLSVILVGALTLPTSYVLVIGVIGIFFVGMYEMVFAGLLFDILHVAPLTEMPFGHFPITALFLCTVTCALIARKTISHTYLFRPFV